MAQFKINWYGNIGRSFPAPGTTKKIKCGVCGAQMRVRRNVLRPTGFAEAVAGREHRHDAFTCPHIKQGWHILVVDLKTDVHWAKIKGAGNFKQKKKAAEKQIIKILKKHAAR